MNEWMPKMKNVQETVGIKFTSLQLARIREAYSFSRATDKSEAPKIWSKFIILVHAPGWLFGEGWVLRIYLLFIRTYENIIDKVILQIKN